jgi:hypothetical protein
MADARNEHDAAARRERESSDRRLRRDLSLQQLFFISFGSIIGSGWLFATLAASAVAGPAADTTDECPSVRAMFVRRTRSFSRERYHQWSFTVP